MQSRHLPCKLLPLAAGLALAGVLALAPPHAAASGAEIVVTTYADELNADGDCSLREAIRAANLNASVDACPAGSGDDTILLAAGTYTLATPGTRENDSVSGDLDVAGNLSIAGPGASATIVSGNRLDRVFDILPAAHVTIAGLTVERGETDADRPEDGGGIRNAGTLTLIDSVVKANEAIDGMGGGIANFGTLELVQSRVDRNTTWAAMGAGIANDGSLTLVDSTISNNSTTFSNAAGIYNSGQAQIDRTTISGNGADGLGGGILNLGSMTLANSTVSRNSAFSDNGATGGGIYNDGTLELNHVTITDNLAETAGGGVANTSAVTLKNTIIAHNAISIPPSAAPDCYGSVTSQGYNIIGNPAGCTIAGDPTGNKLGRDPELGPLDSNRGYTLTQAPLPGSPALDAAAPGQCPPIDQRGAPRPQDGDGNGAPRCDIGAVELDASPSPVLDLLVNGGFEDDADGNGRPDGWSNTSRFSRNGAHARTGSFAGCHRATDNSSYTVSQTVPNIVAGGTYNLYGWVNIPPTNDAFGFKIEIRWRDAAASTISTKTIKSYSSATSGWSQVAIQVVAPANAASAQVRMAQSSLNATVCVDDLVLQTHNLIANNGFEDDANANGRPDGWSSTSRFTRTSAAVHNGSYAGRHRATDNSSYTVSQTVPNIVAGQHYRFSGWVNIPPTSDSFEMKLELRWLDSTNNVVATSHVRAFSAATAGWTQATARWAAPASGKAQVRMVASSLNATVYVDDLWLQPVPIAVLAEASARLDEAGPSDQDVGEGAVEEGLPADEIDSVESNSSAAPGDSSGLPMALGLASLLVLPAADRRGTLLRQRGGVARAGRQFLQAPALGIVRGEQQPRPVAIERDGKLVEAQRKAQAAGLGVGFFAGPQPKEQGGPTRPGQRAQRCLLGGGKEAGRDWLVVEAAAPPLDVDAKRAAAPEREQPPTAGARHAEA